MTMPYMVEHYGQVLGPYSLAELNDNSTAGRIALSDLACDQSSGQWVPVSQLLSIGSAPPSMVPANVKTASPRFNSGLFAGMGGFLLTLAFLLWRAFRIMSALARLHHAH
jgi:hypothetical protein